METDSNQTTWSEECCQCGVLLGGKVFTNKDEFEAHPDQQSGFYSDYDGVTWYCVKCEMEQFAKYEIIDETDIEPNDCIDDETCSMSTCSSLG
jgi:hypothetical protein